MKLAKHRLTQHRPMVAASFALMLIAIYPSDLSHYANCKPVSVAPCAIPAVHRVPTAVFHTTENYLRFVNTGVQIALPFLLRDKRGIKQLLLVGITTMTATHGLKRVLNHRTSAGRRLGQRPWGEQSKHNMPSGHSSMASCAAAFVSRRYGPRHLWYLLPILILTMVTRIGYGEHTVSAVFAGALLGVITTLPITSAFRANPDNKG
ncbi:MAG: phosphatase PAP2 family protein [Burkholderiaceae bacterium]